LIECDAETILFVGAILYPDLLVAMFNKNYKSQIMMKITRSDAKGWQEKKLSEIMLESDLFSQDDDEDLLDHEWLASEKNPADVRNKLYEIFLERSAILFAVSE
jgi:hypothetical protein